MAVRQESLLEDGMSDETKPESTVPTHARTIRWCANIVWLSVFAKEGRQRSKVRRTAYLDGLRGFAAFMVYWGHHQLKAHEAMSGDRVFDNVFDHSFGQDRQYHYFACLPGVRTFFSGGHFAVSVFFVISGYVLSTKPLALMHAGEHIKLADNLASALFRRWLRLYIPVICTTFIYMTSWHVFGLSANHEPQPNYRKELWKWYTEFKNFSFVFKTGGEPWFTYNFHVWSIPIEFKGSIAIYTALLALSRCTRNARLCCQVGLIFYFMYIVDGWFCSMFITGMLLCDLDLLAGNNNLPDFFSRLEPFTKPIFYSFLTISLYLGGVPPSLSYPEELQASPGWCWLSLLKPQAVYDYKWFYLFWASTLLVASIPRISWLKGFFEMRFNQYLGRISFAFYLVHGPVLWTLGDRLYAVTGFLKESPDTTRVVRGVNLLPWSKAGPLGLELGFLLPHLIILPVTVWLAEIVTKLFDEPSVRFSQWSYGSTLISATKS